jgi:hypothetical protein
MRENIQTNNTTKPGRKCKILNENIPLETLEQAGVEE